MLIFQKSIKPQVFIYKSPLSKATLHVFKKWFTTTILYFYICKINPSFCEKSPLLDHVFSIMHRKICFFGVVLNVYKATHINEKRCKTTMKILLHYNKFYAPWWIIISSYCDSLLLLECCFWSLLQIKT